MTESFPELVARFGDAPSIPNDELYAFITREDTRKSLIAAGQIPGALEQRGVYQEVRRRSIEDLFWLSRYMLWDANPHNTNPAEDKYNLDTNIIREDTHKAVCDFFVKKVQGKPLGELDTRKLRMLLYPRNSAKSTVDTHDVVQWVLAYPSIRILYLTSAGGLAEAFLDETKGYFAIREDNPTLMNIFFPTYCVLPNKMGAAGEFKCPVFFTDGKKRKEPTILALGAEANMSGYHFEILKVDDLVSTDNSQNEDQCRKIAHHFNVNKKMLMPSGYCDLIGTRYNPADMYGDLMEKNVGDIRRETPRPCIEYIENLTTGQVFLIGRAVQIKPETMKKLEQEGRPITYKEAGEDGCDILLPNIVPYSRFMYELNMDEKAAEGQFNQCATPAGNITFDRPLLVSCTVDYREVPTAGIRTQTWDFAYSEKKKRDFSTCSSAVWLDEGNCFIQDLVRDRFSPTNLAKAVVAQAKKWHPVTIGIEDSPGVRFLEDTIRSEAYKTGDVRVIEVCSRLDWIPVDKSKDAKRNRIKVLHPWLVEKRMLFANHLPFLDILYSEFEKCLTSSAHDDIPDVISYQPRYAPRVRSMYANQYQDPMTKEQAVDKAMYNLLYSEWLNEDADTDAFGHVGRGIGIPAFAPEPEQETELEARSQIPGVDSVLGSGLIG